PHRRHRRGGSRPARRRRARQRLTHPEKGTHDMSTAVWETTTAAAAPTGDVLEVTAPATGEVIATVGRATVDDLNAAVAAGVAAQSAWAALTYDARAAVMRRAAQILEADPDRLGRWI